MTRVCQLLGGAEDGGLENHFVELCNELARHGESVTAIAHPRFGERLSGVCFAPLDLTLSRRNPLLRRRLRRALADAKPDVAHAQGGKAAALLASVSPKTRTVGTVHGVKRNLGAYQRLDAVIGVSDGVLAGLEHPHQRVVFNGISPPPPPAPRDELETRFGVAPGRTVTMAVGRLVPVKRLDSLIERWDASLGHLVVAGDGPQRAKLDALARNRPVTIAGHVHDVRRFLGAADLLVVSSQREGFHYGIAEALIAGLPVVSTPVAGLAERLPQANIAALDALPEAIARCLRDPQARTRMQPLFDWASETLTLERMAHDTSAVYRELLA